MKRMVLVILPCVLLLGFGSQASAELAPGYPYTNVQVLPISISFVSCSGESVSLYGSYLVVEHYLVDSDGREYIDVTARFRQVTGVSPSGVTYRVLTGDHETRHIGPGATIRTISSPYTIVSQGSDGNLVATGVIHTTILPSGEVSVSFDDHYRYMCVG